MCWYVLCSCYRFGFQLRVDPCDGKCPIFATALPRLKFPSTRLRRKRVCCNSCISCIYWKFDTHNKGQQTLGAAAEPFDVSFCQSSTQECPKLDEKVRARALRAKHWCGWHRWHVVKHAYYQSRYKKFERCRSMNFHPFSIFFKVKMVKSVEFRYWNQHHQNMDCMATSLTNDSEALS